MANSIYELKGGDPVIARMMETYGFTMRKQLQDHLGLGNGTVSTWSTRDFFPGKEIIQIVLEKGVSLRWLATGEGDMYDKNTDNITGTSRLIELKSYKLEDGFLTELENVFIERNLLEIELKDSMLISFNKQKLIIEKKFNVVTNGDWLIAIDKITYISNITRVPGGKWRINEIDWPENEIEFLGKIVAKIEIK